MGVEGAPTPVADGRKGATRISELVHLLQQPLQQPHSCHPCCPAWLPTRRRWDASLPAQALGISTLHLGRNPYRSTLASFLPLPASPEVTLPFTYMLQSHWPNRLTSGCLHVLLHKPGRLQTPLYPATPSSGSLFLILQLSCKMSLPQQSSLIPKYDAFHLS